MTFPATQPEPVATEWCIVCGGPVPLEGPTCLKRKCIVSYRRMMIKAARP